ncbi:hypothetical protein FGO68_gene11020 [Halteria grandinella]|uniref:Uncharacterized protein n=1 Tax=Halteria grandinella TaxID=5974 RepID=A0A8J8NAM0_HALGN|nr:hypothetical protein FGO68_gene11020 [Halteria grandinella]
MDKAVENQLILQQMLVTGMFSNRSLTHFWTDTAENKPYIITVKQQPFSLSNISDFQSPIKQPRTPAPRAIQEAAINAPDGLFIFIGFQLIDSSEHLQVFSKCRFVNVFIFLRSNKKQILLAHIPFYLLKYKNYEHCNKHPTCILING